MMTEASNRSTADYLAAERTLLALQIGQPTLRTRPYGPSFWFGTARIVLGVAVARSWRCWEQRWLSTSFWFTGHPGYI